MMPLPLHTSQEPNQGIRPILQSPSYQSQSTHSTAESRSTVLARSICQHWRRRQFRQLQDSGSVLCLFHLLAPSPTAVARRGPPIGGAARGHQSANHITTVLSPVAEAPLTTTRPATGAPEPVSPRTAQGPVSFLLAPSRTVPSGRWPSQLGTRSASGPSSAQPISSGHGVTAPQHTAHRQGPEFLSSLRDPPPGEAVSASPQCTVS
ncbi:hypothetical protein NDU88_004503 [Pleurodeles waltl]|uniref:Uncharacterized protein n=1 Tax=Pleurodeles waltl TaxID=8319 RepID=A0AAV7SIZ8_PLEWA|nr:hypothetical protein NDU88_004503 [Pleurodeles waltl]